MAADLIFHIFHSYDGKYGVCCMSKHYLLRRFAAFASSISRFISSRFFVFFEWPFLLLPTPVLLFAIVQSIHQY